MIKTSDQLGVVWRGVWVCSDCRLVIELLTSGDDPDQDFALDCPECGAVAEYRPARGAR